MESKMIIACGMDLKQVRQLLKKDPILPILRIGKEGKPTPAAGPGMAGTYLSHIEFAGKVEPFTGKKGLELLRDMIVYNGAERPFLPCFSHFVKTKALHGFHGVYLEQGAILLIAEGRYSIMGQGGLAIWYKNQDTEKSDFQVSQFKPGESFTTNPIQGMVKTPLK